MDPWDLIVLVDIMHLLATMDFLSILDQMEILKDFDHVELMEIIDLPEFRRYISMLFFGFAATRCHIYDFILQDDGPFRFRYNFRPQRSADQTTQSNR